MRSRHIRTYKFDRLVRRVSVKVIACMSNEKLIERANDIEDMLQRRFEISLLYKFAVYTSLS